MTETAFPLESSCSRLTLLGMTVGSVITEVTVTVTGTPTGAEEGVIVVTPIGPAIADSGTASISTLRTTLPSHFRISTPKDSWTLRKPSPARAERAQQPIGQQVSALPSVGLFGED
jgi:hypothetical protein